MRGTRGHHLGASRDLGKSVLSLLTLIDKSQVWRFLQIFGEKCILPLTPWDRHFVARSCFCKTQAASRIPLLMSICKTKKELLAWRQQEQKRLEWDGVTEAEHFTLFHPLPFLYSLWIFSGHQKIQSYDFFQVATLFGSLSSQALKILVVKNNLGFHI